MIVVVHVSMQKDILGASVDDAKRRVVLVEDGIYPVSYLRDKRKKGPELRCRHYRFSRGFWSASDLDIVSLYDVAEVTAW
jgi:hypothetical protein